MPAGLRDIKTATILLVLACGWSTGLFISKALFGSASLTVMSIVTQVMVILIVALTWITASMLACLYSKKTLNASAQVLANVFTPLLLLLALQSDSINEFLGLKRPVMALVLILGLWAIYRLHDKLEVERPAFFITGMWLIFLSSLVGLFFWRLILVSPLHAGSMAEDLLLFFPFKKFVAESVRSGIVPFWNPYVFSGAPMLADSQTAVFHPATLLLALLVRNGELVYRAGELAVIIQYIVVITGTFLFARVIGFKTWTSAVAAIVFTFGGFMVSHVRHLPIINVVVWMPWVLWSQEKFLIRKRLGWQVLASMFLLFAFLGGHLQSVLYVFSFALVYLCWRLYPELFDGDMSPMRKTVLAVMAVIPFPVSLMLGAWQLLPTLELLPLSGRAVDVSYHLTTDFSMALENLITLIAPNFMGGVNGRYWGSWSYWWEFGAYVGIFTLITAAISLLDRQIRQLRFFLAAAGMSIFLALGSNTFLHPLFYLIWPGFYLNRAPSRFLLIFTFAMAFLCAYGLEQLEEIIEKYPEKLQKTRRSVIILAATIASFMPFLYFGLIGAANRQIFEYFSTALSAIVWAVLLTMISMAFLFERQDQMINNRAFKAAVVAFIIFDLFSTWQGWFVEERPPESYYQQDAVVEYIKADDSLYRVDNREVWPPNAGCAYRIQTIGGSNTLSLAGYDRISGLHELLNVKYIVAKGDVDEPGFMKVRAFDDVSVYRNENVTPRAVMAGSARIISDREEIFNKVSSRTFSMDEVVYLEDQSLKDKAEKTGLGENYDSKIDIPVYEPNYMKLEVNNSQPGFLVLSEIYYPGWTAKIDGQSTNIYRADYALRAIWLEEGTHRVDFEYRPDSFYRGLNISLMTAIVLMLGLAGEVLMRRRQARKRQ